jgi:threonine/homoserine/homoserine lactone efflux protein
MSPVIQGLLIGLGTSFIIGPVFFTLIKNSIQGSKSNGFLTAIGILVSDILVAFICLIFSKEFLINYVNQTSSQLLGASILAFFGVSFFLKPVQISNDPKHQKPKNAIKSLMQGFSINFINPAVFIIWIGFITLAEQSFSYPTKVYWFIFGILMGIFSTDIIKVLGASFIMQYLNPKKLIVISRIIGLFLLLSSTIIIVKALV